LERRERQLDHARVLEKCDGIDASSTGQITNPPRSRFDIDRLGLPRNLLTRRTWRPSRRCMPHDQREGRPSSATAAAKFGSEANFDPNFATTGATARSSATTCMESSELAQWREKINFSDIYDHTKESSRRSPQREPGHPGVRAAAGEDHPFPRLERSVVPPDGSLAYFFALTQFEKLHQPAQARLR